MTQRSAGVKPSSLWSSGHTQVKVSITDCFYTYMSRNYCYFDPRVHQAGGWRLSQPNPTPNMEAGTKPHWPWINGSRARADLCFKAQSKRELRSIEKKVIPLQRSGAVR